MNQCKMYKSIWHAEYTSLANSLYTLCRVPISGEQGNEIIIMCTVVSR